MPKELCGRVQSEIDKIEMKPTQQISVTSVLRVAILRALSTQNRGGNIKELLNKVSKLTTNLVSQRGDNPVEPFSLSGTTRSEPVLTLKQ